MDNTGKSNQSHWSVFLYGNSAEMRKIEGKFCGKNIGMNMSLFLYGNSAEMRETAWGKFCGEKTEAWKWDYFCMEFCGNEGNWGKIMYSNIFIYVSLIGNGTWKNVCQQQSTEFFSPISIQFRTFPYRDVFPSDFRTFPYNFTVLLKCAEIQWKCTEISFQFFSGIPQNSTEKISVQFCGILRKFLGRAEVGWHLKVTYR